MTNPFSCTLLTLDDPRWLDLIDHHPDANIFHKPAWINMVANCYGYHPFVAAVIDEQGQLAAGLPVIEIVGLFNKRRWISLPFTDDCALLSTQPQAQPLLEQFLLEEARRQNVSELELRRDSQSPGYFHSTNYVATTLKLFPNIDEIAKKIKGSEFRKIRTPVKFGVKFIKGTSPEMLDAYYRLHIETRRRLGVPVQPRQFFNSFREMLLEQGLGYIWLATLDDEIVAGMISLHSNQKIMYKYSATNDRGRAVSASYMLIWEAIRWGCENGFTLLDWGRTDIDNIGLRRYKKQWGSDESPLVYSRNIQSTPHSLRQKFTPLVKAVINKSPLWVCRLSGELLYRYFG